MTARFAIVLVLLAAAIVMFASDSPNAPPTQGTRRREPIITSSGRRRAERRACRPATPVVALLRPGSAGRRPRPPGDRRPPGRHGEGRDRHRGAAGDRWDRRGAPRPDGAPIQGLRDAPARRR